MGATRMTDVKATHLGLLNGQDIFVISEETYELNLDPHTPSFCTMVIGTYQDGMERAKSVAYSIPSGMLKGYTVNSVMTAFDKAMRNPVKVHGNPVLDLHPQEHFDGLMEESYPVIEQFQPEIAKQLKKGQANRELKLLDNLEMVIELSKTVAVWRFVSVNIHGQKLELNLPEPTVTPKNATIPKFAVVPSSTGGEGTLFKEENGHWMFADQEWKATQAFIDSLVFSTLAQFKKDMRAFNKALKNTVAYGDVKLAFNNPVEDCWSGSDEFNADVGKSILLSNTVDSYLFEEALKTEGNAIELVEPLASKVFDLEAWHTTHNPEAKSRLKEGAEIETKDPIEFTGGTETRKLKKASMGRKRNVWYDLENKEYVRVNPNNLGEFKFLKLAS
jgi:hypothetical protein